MEKTRKLRPLEQTDKLMDWLRIILGVCGFVLFGIILFKVISHDEPDDYLFRALETTRTIVPTRGNILDTKGRILATSTVSYEISMDCSVQADTLWNNNIRALCKELAKLRPAKNENEWYKILQGARNKKAQFLSLLNDISQEEIYKVRKMPILRKGQMQGGYIEERKEKRLYPYEGSARRTIGYVSTNSEKVTARGIEGVYDKYLHGTDGQQVFRKSDFGLNPVDHHNNRKAKNGIDVRSTIDIDIQNIADRALRKTVDKSDLIEMACAIVMETETGAIRAMVNLGRDTKGNIGEWDNYALRNADPPGSVFKTAVLMAMLEDGYISSLDDEIPTYDGKWYYNGKLFDDVKHLNRKRFPIGKIKVREAFEMSANNPFRQMICNDSTYGRKPVRFVERVKSFGLIDTIAFDISGAAVPMILDPSYKRGNPKGFWDGTSLPRMAIGYNMEISPLNLITFYNAIANDGRMMKPYLVEAIEEEGDEVESFSPEVMHRRICRREVCDTLKKVMSMVTSNQSGTAYWQLRGSVCPIAGKTGTAQRLFKGRNGKWTYNDGGMESQRGTFVGFFPVEEPEYTVAVVVWNKPSLRNFYGATYAAPVFKEIADQIYCLNDKD